MNLKQVILLTLSGIVLFGGLYGVYVFLGAGPNEKLVAQIKEERPTDRTLWNKEGEHTLVMFSDYECPACNTFHEYLTGFEASSSPNLKVVKNVAFVFRYFPLYQIHAHAFTLAYAAEAAARQGKFEEATKRFFADQVKIKPMKDLTSYLAQVAQDLKLDSKKFMADMQDESLKSIIQNDLSLGEELGVNSTPTFYLDGEKLENIAPVDLGNQLMQLK